MPRTPSVYGAWNREYYGEYLTDPVETNVYGLQNAGFALDSVWHYQDFWQTMGPNALWTPSRQDAPERFRIPWTADGKPAGELYTPQTRSFAFNVDIAQGLMAVKLMAHAFGHHFSEIYHVGPVTDDAGQEFWEFCRRSGAVGVEDVANAIGAVLLTRLGVPPDKPVIPGMDALMEAHRIGRTT